MSYKVYTWRKPGETADDCGCTSLLMEDWRKAWSMISLIGEGEHQGTQLSLTKQQLYSHRFEGERELSGLLDRLFRLAHQRRQFVQIDALKPPLDPSNAAAKSPVR